ncbi:hypothetical protein [Tenacibaculum sp. SG-28]|uniref:hypothetical protein n=1 Tax=Tenacibaculum sp. SG-28 TaxID=754426 RepID=UPI003512ECA3
MLGFVFYDFIGSVFSKEPVVLKEFYTSFWVVLVMQPICAIAFIYDGIFKGLGEVIYLRNVLLVATAIVFIPVLLFLDHQDLKLYAIWGAFFAWIVARSIPLILIFRNKFSSVAEVK